MQTPAKANLVLIGSPRQDTDPDSGVRTSDSGDFPNLTGIFLSKVTFVVKNLFTMMIRSVF